MEIQDIEINVQENPAEHSASQREEVEEWIRLVGERYPDMDFVDVVNEPLNAPPPFMNALGGNGETGWDWPQPLAQWLHQQPNHQNHRRCDSQSEPWLLPVAPHRDR